MTGIKGKKVLMIIAPRNFRDEELFHTKEELEKAGINVTIASTSTGQARGMFGAVATPGLTIDAARIDDYDAVVFVGGSGSEIYFNNPRAIQIAKEAYAKNKLVTAICIAPSILANAKVLVGKKATVWAGDTKYVNILTTNGAKYTGTAVQEDGRIITANGPEAARKFGSTIVKYLSK